MKNGQQRYGVPDTENRIANSWQRVLQTLQHINHYRQAFWFLVAYFFFIDGVDTIVTMATVIGEDLHAGSPIDCRAVFNAVCLAGQEDLNAAGIIVEYHCLHADLSLCPKA